MSSDTSIEDLIRTASLDVLVNLHTAIPCIVTDVIKATGLVECSIAVSRILDNGDSVQLPPIANVPVMFSGSNGNSIIHSIAIGDEGLLIFSERDFSRFLASGEISDPTVKRFHNYSDAIFIPTSLSDSTRQPIPDSGLTITDDSGTKIIMDANAITIEGDFKINGNLIVDGDVSATGDIDASNVNATGDVMAGTISLKTHTHTDSQGGATTPPL